MIIKIKQNKIKDINVHISRQTKTNKSLTKV